MINNVTIAGNLTRDMEVRETSNGFQIGSFGIAVNDRKKNRKTGEYEEYPHFFDVKVLGARAEGLAPFLTRGKHVTIQGHLSYEAWTDRETGATRSKVEIVMDEIDLGPKVAGSASAAEPAVIDGVTELSYDDVPF